ncbi:reverse transcriptase domain-containing protein [Tanacetum coccineum]
MAYSRKSMDLNKFVVKDDMIDYVLHKYRSNMQVHDAIADDILDDLLKRGWKPSLEGKRENGYYQGKRKNDDEKSSDHNPLQATSDESSDHNPFQATSDEISDDNLKSSSKDTCSSDRSSSTKAKKATIPSEIVQWYDDLSSDDQRTVRSWSIPSQDPYEEAARQALEQAPRPSEYVPDPMELEDHVPVNWKEYAGTLPLCNKCKFHHVGLCTKRCNNCKWRGHQARDCRISSPKAKPRPSMAKLKVEATCYECGELGHYKRDCPIVKLQNRMDKYWKGKARGDSIAMTSNINI